MEMLQNSFLQHLFLVFDTYIQICLITNLGESLHHCTQISSVNIQPFCLPDFA